VLAYPALLGIRRALPEGGRMILLTSPGVAPFARLLELFDEMVLIKEGSLSGLFLSALAALRRCRRVDTVIDIEVYSRMTTVFSVLTGARNRMGFYLDRTFWRRGLHTHLVFFNRFSGVHHFYEKVCSLLGASPVPWGECGELLKRRLSPEPADPARRRIAVGASCSGFGRERMLSAGQWIEVFSRKGVADEEIVFLGGGEDRSGAEEIVSRAVGTFPNARFRNLCGETDLKGALDVIASSAEYWGVDSGLIHFARLFGMKTVSFWGPTDPATRLRRVPGLPMEVYYRKVPCSPCIHVAETPPCRGVNVCIGSLFRDEPLRDISREMDIYLLD
jgi:ADP-heptose:LPS heptosyltransferase